MGVYLNKSSNISIHRIHIQETKNMNRRLFAINLVLFYGNVLTKEDESEQRFIYN